MKSIDLCMCEWVSSSYFDLIVSQLVSLSPRIVTRWGVTLGGFYLLGLAWGDWIPYPL